MGRNAWFKWIWHEFIMTCCMGKNAWFGMIGLELGMKFGHAEIMYVDFYHQHLR